MKPLDVPYNSQRDNPESEKLEGGSQCAYTMMAMALSQFLPEARTDDWIRNVIRRIEAGDLRKKILAAPGFKQRLTRIGAHGEAIAAAANFLLQEAGTCKSVIWYPQGASEEQLEAAIDSGVLANLSTMITGAGHFICVAGYTRDHWICKDPFGNWNTGYRDTNGDNVHYERKRLFKFCRGAYVPYRFWYIV